MSMPTATEETIEKYKSFKQQIINVKRGPYYHNIVSLILKDCARQIGNVNANNLIDELELEFNKAEV